MSDDIPQFLRTSGTEREEPQPRRSSPRDEGREWGWVVLVVIFLLVLGAAVWGWQRRQSAVADATPTPSPIELFTTPPLFSPTPTPTPVPKDLYTLTVLNGSGTPGEAGEIQGILEDAGYEVTNADNAENFNFTDAVVRYPPDAVDAYIDELVDVLKDEFTAVERETDDGLADDEIVVVTGSDRAGVQEESGATATPAPTENPEATESAQ